MPEIDLSNPIEILQVQLVTLKDLLSAAPKQWDAKKAVASVVGDCDRAHYSDDANRIMPVLKIGDKRFCEEHFEYAAEEVRKELERSIKKLESEISFRQTMEKAHRFKDVKSLVDAVKVILKKSSGSYYGDKDPFTAEDKEQGKQLLQILDKIKPQSSPFLDRGVAINQDLYLAGQVESRRADWDSRYSTPTVLITALDRDERYKSIARVGLTIGEAERLRNLLVECIEHVRIARMMKEIQDKMKISLPKPEPD